MLGENRRAFGAHIEIGGELPNNRYNGRDWNYRAYQDAVEARLLRIRNSETGRILLDALTRPVLIVPRTVEDGNAETRAVDSIDPDPFSLEERDAPDSNAFAARAGTMEGVPTHGAAGAIGVRGTIAEVMLTGSGTGTASVIEFTPGFHAPGNVLAQRGMWTGRSVELLLHELVHAVMAGRGLSDPRPLSGAQRRYHNTAEFNAVMVTNIFRSEVTPGARLRDSHENHFDVMTNPSGFYTANASLVEAFCTKAPALARRLAAVRRARFNPCRAHLSAATAAP